MKDIEKTLVEQYGMDGFAAITIVKNLNNHDDLMKEFLDVLKNKAYPENGAVSKNWTAKALSEKLPHLPVNIIYEFMAGLRDKPEEYEGYKEE